MLSVSGGAGWEWNLKALRGTKNLVKFLKECGQGEDMREDPRANPRGVNLSSKNLNLCVTILMVEMLKTELRVFASVWDRKLISVKICWQGTKRPYCPKKIDSFKVILN